MKLLRWLIFVALNIGAVYLIDFSLIKLILFLMGWTISSTFGWITFILCISVFVLPLVYLILSFIVSPLYYLCPKKRIGIIVIKSITCLDSILTIALIWGATIGGYEVSNNYKILVTIAFIIKTIMILKLANKINTDFKLNNESNESDELISISVDSKEWKDLSIGHTKEYMEKFLSDPGIISSKYEDIYFVDYKKYGLLVNYNLISNVSKALFFYNQDVGASYIQKNEGYPIRVKESISWDSSVKEVEKVFGVSKEQYESNVGSCECKRIVYAGIDFRFIEGKLVRICILLMVVLRQFW